MELGRYLCEVRAGQYWRVDNLKSFDEFLEKKFPESRRKAYYLMAIHEQLPRQTHHELKQVGWTKASGVSQGRTAGRAEIRLCNLVAQSAGAAEGGVQAGGGTTPDRQGNRALGDALFQDLQEPTAVIEQALETASLMLGGQKARGYCLEMICADFLAGANLETGNQDALLSALTRLVLGIPMAQREQLFESVQGVP